MCGIAGFIVNELSDKPEGILLGMLDVIAHRGPDDFGTDLTSFNGGSSLLALGHRRLSIIDLQNGHQPMESPDGSIKLIFNGEIYNHVEIRGALQARGHRFATNSDSEAIIYAYKEYGEACVEHLRGMFAFAIWDSREEKLFLARDRYGKKPLFFSQFGGEIAFASEIKSLLRFPKFRSQIDLQSVFEYLSYRYVPGPSTLFENVTKLPPGCFAVWQRGTFKQEQYYVPPDRQPQQVEGATSSIGNPVDAFMEQLEESVRIRMISDVPFGAFLSGGIDSSAIVGLMARNSDHPIKTFSIGFTESQYSELGYAKVIADRFKTEHHELSVSQDQLMDLLPAMIDSRDAPVSEPSDIPMFLLAKEAQKNVKVVLTGEGSDELLGGYPKHVYERYVRAYQMWPKWVRNSLVEPLVQRLPYKFRRIKTAALNFGLDSWPERMVRWFGALSDKEFAELVAPSLDGQNLDWKSRPGLPPHFDTPASNSALRRILYFDQTSWLPDNLLERGDRVTMAASIEARTPFLDHHLANFVTQLPDRYRVNKFTTKWILREAMKSMLPEEILNRPKVGFRVPVNKWFQESMRDVLYDRLTGPNSLTSSYYHPRALMRILDEHVAGQKNHEKLLWTLLNLEIWHERYVTPVPPASTSAIPMSVH